MTREEKLGCIEVAMRCSWLTAKISDEDVYSVYEAMMGDDGDGLLQRERSTSGGVAT